MNEPEAVESGWTNANLQKLLSAMKDCIPERDKTFYYIKGMKSLDWDKVSFPPFSPEECKQKWTEIIEKMRKFRSITELIAEAEVVILDPLHNRKFHPEIPNRPPGPTTFYLMKNIHKYKKKYPAMKHKDTFKLLNEKFKKLPDEERAKYEENYACKITEYKKKMQAFGKQNRMHAIQRRYDEDVDLPTKPPYSSYALFCMEYKSSGETSKCGAMDMSFQWRNLSQSKRAECQTRWKELKRQYSVELHSYLDRFSAEEQKRIIKKNGLKMHRAFQKKASVPERRPNEPKMPSRVPYSYFSGEQIKLLKDKVPSLKERFTVTHELWMKLPMKEKESYKSKMNAKLMKYSAELKMWFKTLLPEEQLEYFKENPSKAQYLDVTIRDGKEQRKHQTSDSEDEDMSISDEEDISYSHVEEEEEEEEDDIITFEIY